ncbi:hypothetical protein C3L33_03930, partial [Rhododendron williamsianum]
MGISIASKNKFALVIHGEVSERQKKDTYEHYTFISLISWKITELPKGLTCPNLEFLLLDCRGLEELPCKFFEGMEKLKVLVLDHFNGILALPPSLRNLHTLSLPNFNGKLENVSEFGGLCNLKTLCFRNSRRMEELPEEIGELVSLSLLDLTGYYGLRKRIPPNVISRLVNLEELYVGGVVDLRKGRRVDFKKLYGRSKFKDWEGEGKEEEGRNANLRELEFLSNLNTLEIFVRSDVLIPKVRIFSKLKIYKVIIVQDYDKYNIKFYSSRSEEDVWDKELEDEIYNLFGKCKRVFMVGSSIPVPSDRGGIDSLLRRSDCLCLKGKGCNDLVQALLLRFPKLEVLKLVNLPSLKRFCRGIDQIDFPQLKELCLAELQKLTVERCNSLEVVFELEGLECNEPKPEILSPLKLVELRDLPKLNCISKRDPVGFKYIQTLQIWKCNSLRYVFAPTMTKSIPQLRKLEISRCEMLSRIVAEENGLGESSVDEVEFPQLERLELLDLPNLVSFFPNVNVNTTTLAKSTDHYHNPLQPQPLFNDK